MASLGFVGLGNMGSRMAKRLIQAGQDLVVYDIRPEAVEPFRSAGVTIVSSPAEVSSRAEIVLVSLPTPNVVEDVALGKNGLRDGGKMRVYVDLSTIGPRTARFVAERLKANEVDALDAPVSGGVPGAEKGTLAIMASGPKDTFENCRPVLEIIGKNIFYVGEKPGQGQMMKLVNNLLSATALVATSEAMVLGVKAGLEPKTMLDVLNAGSGRNSATEDKFPRSVVTRKFDYGFKTALMYKDLKLCMDEAEIAGVPMWVGTAVREMWKLAVATGGGDRDFTTIVQYFEDWAGVTVSSVH